MGVRVNDSPGRSDGPRWRARAENWPGLAALVLLCLAVYLPGLWTIPVVDRDEARFAQASRQMAESGDWVIPRVVDTPRLNKPPLIYWAQGWTARLLTAGDMRRDAIWMYRLPSVLGAILVVVLAWRLGCAMFDPRVAWAAAALLAICPVMVWEARQARADMVMVAFITAAVWLLWETFRRRSLVCAVALWIAVGFGVLTKGPAPLIVVVPAMLAWCLLHRSWAPLRATRPLLGILILGAMVLPWVGLVAARVGLPEYLGIIARETLGRSVKGQEGHWGPPGYHTLMGVLMLFPASLWVIGGLFRATRTGLRWSVADAGWWRRTRTTLRTLRAGRAPECFLLCIVLPTWVVFECVGTKLPHYTMPAYPALALLAARGAMSSAPWLRDWCRRPWVVALVWAWLPVAIGFGAAAGVVGYVAAEGGVWWAWGVMGAAAAGVLVFAVEGRRLIIARDYTALLWRAARLWGVCAALIGLSLPHVKAVWVVSRLVDAARAQDPDATRPLAFVDLFEDSSRFLTRGRVAWIRAGDAPAFLREHPDALLVMPADVASQWDNLRTLNTVAGVNYSKGQRGSWVLVESAP
jgi:4-amino-4-deoxy-L-arabinose transferase-like glycosyltransferase